ncbi:MAG: PAS domain S-box protein, partial [Acidobacteriota bacterium]
MCRLGVELGRSRLGFDRLGIWLVDQTNPNLMVGTWGVDENGQLRDERHSRLSIDANEVIKSVVLRKNRLAVFSDAPLFNDRADVVGRGTTVAAPLWDGEQVIGYVSMDNLLQRQPITEHQCDLLTLYASTLGQLCPRKRAEEALRESDEKYRSLVNNSNDIVCTADESGNWTFLSPSVKSILGYEPAEMVGRSAFDFMFPADIASTREAHDSIVREGRHFWEYENRWVSKDGSLITLSWNAVELRDRRGTVIGTHGVGRDITERKKAEEEKRLLQEQLAQAQKMEALGTLAGGIAHEYNNILAAVIGYTDLTLQIEGLSSTARRNLETVRNSASRAADLTRSLLTFSRKEVRERKPVNLLSVVDEVLSVTQKEFTSEGIELSVEHSTRVPLVMGDAGMLSSVVMNLVINARHAMLKSPVKKLNIRMGLEKGRAFIRVADTGCGIPNEDLPRVFEPFFTTKGSLAGGKALDGKARGTGLGLSVCHSIIKRHGGEIKVTSQVGKGTTFTVYLPAATKRKTTQPKVVESGKEEVSRIL